MPFSISFGNYVRTVPKDKVIELPPFNMGSLPQGLDIPALTPPPGVASNFIDRQSRGSDLIITSAICLTLMSLLVMIRFYTKIYIKHKLGWDDCK